MFEVDETIGVVVFNANSVGFAPKQKAIFEIHCWVNILNKKCMSRIMVKLLN